MVLLQLVKSFGEGLLDTQVTSLSAWMCSAERLEIRYTAERCNEKNPPERR